MQQLLAIETSSEACSVALCVRGEILQRHQLAPLKHAELVLPAVRSLLAEAGLTLGNLDAIAFGRGPGSFTSLRIGIGVVQGLAWGANLPVVPVSSLAAAAQTALALEAEANPGLLGGTPGSHQILVALDARMGEVFHCGYAVSTEGLVQALGPERVSAPAAVNVAAAAWILAAGNGFERYAELKRLGGTLTRLRPEVLPGATAVISLAQHWLRQNGALPAADAQPVYVRNRVAEKPSKL
ncbi:MAG TPA: tRNA (adenosine(37)-N6)-threonylcarbamoyltransferase complex dimerization subunit type 1 TsaB [Xanthomonadales bacterium]|nr:tRNA (adenosine(37)-N6)-threonylcarbamoyltransferase complex dimerization subunit type 1 TsaB [Xanthomonadales bacterium]